MNFSNILITQQKQEKTKMTLRSDKSTKGRSDNNRFKFNKKYADFPVPLIIKNQYSKNNKRQV